MNKINPKIKICGIKNPNMALNAIALGANYIGLIFHENSKRNITFKVAEEISGVTKKAGGIPVAVFVNQHAKEMSRICNELNIDHVQLHGNIPRKEHYKLNPSIHRIYVKQVTHHATVINNDQGEKQLNKDRDFILYDGVNPGSGESYLFHDLALSHEFRCFIAGGLTINTIDFVIKTCRPYGVDVSSGVENNEGEKDKNLISEFIHTARSYYEA